MRRWPLLLGLVGCFSEPPTDTVCTPGEPGCDCKSDGTCVAESECVASIDKCVPTDCTPGSRTCTCAENMECLTGLTCQEGVCLDPPSETTGDPTNASTAPSTTVDDTLTGPMTSTPETSDSSETMPPMTESGTGTSATSPTSGPETTMTTDPSSDTAPMLTCPECLMTADMCPSFSSCTDDTDPGGCADLYQCVLADTMTVNDCCSLNALDPGHLVWNSFAACADDLPCASMCFWTCEA